MIENFTYDNLQALREKDAYVYKYGGDNAGDVFENCQALVEKVAEHENPKKIVLAISAIRNSDESRFGGMRHSSVAVNKGDSSSEGFNTTNHLIALGKVMSKEPPEVDLALDILNSIKEFTTKVVTENLSQDPECEIEPIVKVIEDQCEALALLIKTEGVIVKDLGRDQVLALSDGSYRSISGFGEDIARDIYASYLGQKSEIKAKRLKTEDLYNEVVEEGGDLMEIKTNQEVKTKAESKIKLLTKERVMNLLEEADIIISGGHVPVLALEKGYSEKVAAVIAGILQKEGLSTAMGVEKQFPLLSLDPRIAKLFADKGIEITPKVLEKVDIGMAQNLFAETFGNAGAVQWGALVEAIQNGVEIFVYNPEQMRSDRISRICNIQSDYTGVENVTLREEATHIGVDLLDNPNTSNQEVLGVIGEILDKHRYEVLATNFSKTKVTFTINGTLKEKEIKAMNKLLKKRSKDKEKPMSVKVNNQVSALIMMGKNMERSGILYDIAGALYGANVNILEPGHTDDQEAIPFIIDCKDALLAAVAVHLYCIETPSKLDATKSEIQKIVQEKGIIKASQEIYREAA